jgi:hypothetical protein
MCDANLAEPAARRFASSHHLTMTRAVYEQALRRHELGSHRTCSKTHPRALSTTVLRFRIPLAPPRSSSTATNATWLMKSMFKKNAISGSVKPPFAAKNRRYRDGLLVRPTAARRSARSSGLRARISTRRLSRNTSTAEYLAASDMANKPGRAPIVLTQFWRQSACAGRGWFGLRTDAVPTQQYHVAGMPRRSGRSIPLAPGGAGKSPMPSLHAPPHSGPAADDGALSGM